MRFAFFSLIFMVLASFYLYGYWMTFGIDPFPYLGPDQIVFHSLGALCGLAISLLLGFGFGAIRKPKQNGKDLNSHNWKNEIYIIILGVILIVSGIYLEKSLIFAGVLLILGLFASIPLANSETFKILSNSYEVRRKLILLLFISPPFGNFAGSAYTYLRLDSPSSQKVVWVANSDYKKLIGTLYIGRLGDSDVFLSKETGLTFILPASTFGGIGFLKSTNDMPPSSQSGDITN